MKNTQKILLATLATLFLVSGCSDDDPVKEDIPEVITKATLTFTPSGSGSVVKVTATDPDADGPKSLSIDGEINLVKGITYTLSVEMINELAEPTSADYNITDEVNEEGFEHQFYFGWTGNVFSNPTGNGNIDNRSDAVNYKDKDKNNLPIGLSTEWTTSATAIAGTNTFNIVLKHQPDLKSATSTFNDGETDLDLTFPISVN